MKRMTLVLVVAALAALMSGCEALLALFGSGPSAVSQVEGFIVAANADPRDLDAVRSYFDPLANDYTSMLDESYWDTTVFAAANRDFALSAVTEAGENTSYPGSETVQAILTSAIDIHGTPVSFVLQRDSENVPLIRAILFPDYTSTQEQVQDFLSAATTMADDPDSYDFEDLKAFFDPDAAQYANMQLRTYWDGTYFSPSPGGPFTITGIAQGAEDPEYPGSQTVTGTVTSPFDSGYSSTFVLTPSAEFAGTPLIRQITVNSGDIVIRRVIPE